MEAGKVAWRGKNDEFCEIVMQKSSLPIEQSSGFRYKIAKEYTFRQRRYSQNRGQCREDQI